MDFQSCQIKPCNKPPGDVDDDDDDFDENGDDGEDDDVFINIKMMMAMTIALF